MLINQAQEIIRKSDDIHGWSDRFDAKDLCLNINEEIGELWNLIKWIPENEQRDIIKNNYEKAYDFIGDILFWF